MSIAAGVLPNLFLVGAPRAGTTTLYRMLASHPLVCMNTIKEPNYFAKDILTSEFQRARGVLGVKRDELVHNRWEGTHFAYVPDWETYQSLFRGGKGEVVFGEASTLYLQSKAAASEIRSGCPDAKIVMVLRHPVERAFSEYRMNLAIGYTRSTFCEDIQREMHADLPAGGLIAGSLYYSAVSRYLHTFGRERVLIFLYEDLEALERVAARLFAFLELGRNKHALAAARLNSAS